MSPPLPPPENFNHTPGAPGHVDIVGSVNTIKLRRYGWNTSTEGSLRRKKDKKTKVEEFQKANLASLGTLASNDIEIFNEKILHLVAE